MSATFWTFSTARASWSPVTFDSRTVIHTTVSVPFSIRMASGSRASNASVSM